MDKKKECPWKIAAIMLGVSTLGLIIFACYSEKFTLVLYLKKMFYSEKNGFNWTAFTALAAVLALGFNWNSNQQQIKANLKSKSRIEWIQKARDETSELLTQIMKLHQAYSTLNKMSEEKDLARIYARLNNSYSSINKLILYFGPDKSEKSPNEEDKLSTELIIEKKCETLINQTIDNTNKNNEIVWILNYLKEKLKEDEKKLNDRTLVVTNMEIEEKIINQIADILRLYFKLEWNRAKEGY